VHRFFLSPGSIADGRATFGPAQAHQLRHVLRLRPGAQVIVLDGTGWEYEVELVHLERDRAIGEVHGSRPSGTEPRLSLTLYQSVLRGDRFEWVLQKGTELGVAAFVPLLCQRTIPIDAQRVEAKRSRWERIIREAAEQSYRARLPSLAEALPFAASCARGAQDHDLALMPWEEAERHSLSGLLRDIEPLPDTVALWIGPEGGFDPDEAAIAREQGIQPVTLGPRILRAETAALAAVTIVLSALDEMGS
jgi:16S rRNA (uracil1498-N3)-methyltransferase